MDKSKPASESAFVSQWERERFSTSVNSVLDSLESSHPEADFRDVLSAFYRIHSEYATLPEENVKISRSNSRPSQFISILNFLDDKLKSVKLNKFQPSEWAGIVINIFKIPSVINVINGRMFCIAVVLYEYETIASHLHQNSTEWTNQSKLFISLLSQELIAKNVNAKNELTEHGMNLWAELFGPSGQSLYETVNISDLPSEVDFLSRKALASYLANRLRYVYKKEVLGMRETSKLNENIQKQKAGAFFMHIDGAWGSGKSTLLGFLKTELETKENGKDWIVVDFNAWQHQRLDPPWWFLMKAVHQQAMDSLSKNRRWGKLATMQLKELAWRMNTGTNYLVAALITCALFVGVTYAGVVNELEWKGLPLVQLGSFIGFLWSFTSLLRSGLVPGSARAALKFIQEHGNDPMQALSSHFEKKCRDLGQPVAVFIDDLDRCDKDYGVQLLEGLQTIFKKAPVVFAIACDRKWLITMYESQFNLFSAIIGKPAKPFGIVFLDKIFQLSIELPSISTVHKENYWNHLLNLQNTGNGNGTDIIRQEIKEEVHQKATNYGKLNTLKETEGSLRSQIKREEILTALSIGEEEKYLEHRLQKFLPLIDPNPRAMKRIINDISTVKAITFLYNQDVDEDQLILWTILKIQYPLIAEYFWNHPDRLSAFQKDNLSEPIIDKPELDLIVKDMHARSLFAFRIADQTVKLDSRFLSIMKFEEPVGNSIDLQRQISSM